jgi:hypothetical protein
MDAYKEKYLTTYQRIRLNLKRELKKDQTFITRMKVKWFRRQLEIIRTRQFGRGEK